MTPLSDHDLQAILSGDLDPSEVSDRLDATAQAGIDAYREVWAALEAEPASFAPGFADRVAGALEAEREARPAPRQAWAASWVGIAAAVALLVFRASLDATFAGVAPTEALPWIAAAFLVIAATDAIDRANLLGPARRTPRS